MISFRFYFLFLKYISVISCSMLQQKRNKHNVGPLIQDYINPLKNLAEQLPSHDIVMEIEVNNNPSSNVLQTPKKPPRRLPQIRLLYNKGNNKKEVVQVGKFAAPMHELERYLRKNTEFVNDRRDSPIAGGQDPQYDELIYVKDIKDKFKTFYSRLATASIKSAGRTRVVNDRRVTPIARRQEPQYDDVVYMKDLQDTINRFYSRLATASSKSAARTYHNEEKRYEVKSINDTIKILDKAVDVQMVTSDPYNNVNWFRVKVPKNSIKI